MAAAVSAPADLSLGFSRALLGMFVDFLLFCVVWEYWLLTPAHLVLSVFYITEIPTNVHLPHWALSYFLLLLWIICYFSGAWEQMREKQDFNLPSLRDGRREKDFRL